MSQGQKRAIDQDPDYESIPVEAQQKRLKLHEQDAKDAAVKKIEQIVRNQFCDEISTREAELDLINKRIYQAQIMLERLRVGIITKYYATGGQTAAESSVASTRGGWEDSQQALASVHPTVRKFLGKGLPAHLQTANKSDEGHHHNQAELKSSLTLVTEDAARGDTGVASKFATEHSAQHPGKESGKQTSTTRIVRAPRCKEKVRVIVGNVSKYIPLDRRDDGGRDQATHKWLAYVRTAPEEPYTIGELVRHVRFFLHPSYRPHDLVEITEPPFQVQRKGWGEFPLRVQLHFHDRWTKHVDIIHQLKLDKTYTGLQTLGAETLVDLWLPASALKSKDSSTAANDLSVCNGSMDKTTAVPDGKAIESISASGSESIAAGRTESKSSSICASDCEDPLPRDITSQHSETSTVIESAPTVSSALAAEQPCSFTGLIKTEPEVSTVSADMESSTAHPVEVDTTQPPQAKCSASKPAVTEVLQMPSPTIQAGVNTVGASTESSTAQPVVVDTSQPPQAKCSASKPAVTAVLQMPSPIVLPGTALSLVNVAPKPVPPKASVAVNSNGVNPPTYVQCTDALGRVLLIPATSLLSASNSPAQQAPQQASQPSSLLQPSSAAVIKTAISDTNATVSTSLSVSVPKPLSFVLAGASTCTPNASAVNITTVEATAGVSMMKRDTAMGVIHEKMASTSSKIQVNSATAAITPSSIAHVVNAAGANILSNVTTLPLPKASITSPGPRVQKIGPALKLIRPALPLSAASVNRTAVPAGALCAAFPPTVVGTSGAGLVNVSSSVASVVPMSPIIKGGVKPSVSNRTNLLSIVCNKPAATSANTSAAIVPDALQQLVAIAPAADKASPLSVACSKPASERTAAVMLQATPSVMPSTSKGKSAPSSSAYTLVMIPGTGSGQSQVVLVPTASVKPTVPAPVVVQGKQSPQPSASPESQVVPKVLYPAASLLAQLEKVDPVKELQDKLYAIRFDGFKDVREALFAVVAHFPLVGVKECEKLNCFPYAATDGATFFSWPLPKRRASEWMRACDVRRTLQLLVERQQPSFLSHLPSRRAIVLLCRRFGFTPLHPDVDGEIEGAEKGSKAPDAGTHNSYSEPSELVSQLASAACAMESVHDDAGNVEEEVDVVGHDGADSTLRSRETQATSLPKQNSGKDTILHCDSSPEKCLPRKAKVHLPLSPKAAFVREAASEVGVHLSSCELEPRIDIPVVEEMIVSACKNFATQLMRSAVNLAFKRVGNERIPSVVTLEDMYHGILDHKECSFLTNENLGIESTREGSADNTHL